MGHSHGPRAVALVGPYLSGKTTLLESILFVTGATTRKGRASERNMVGDSSAEARERQMGTELNVAATSFLGDRFTVLDCPGSIELTQESLNALVGVDAAVVVCEADPARAPALMPILKFLDDRRIPRVIFVNKIDKGVGTVGDLVEALQAVSTVPLVLRQVPIVESGKLRGYVDLASERAWIYRAGGASERVDMPKAIAETEKQARFAMLEKLADHDDALMELLLEDKVPPVDQVYADLSKEFQDGLIVPVILGAAEQENGVRRLLKLLRHEVPDATVAAARVGLGDGAGAVAQVLKTMHTATSGKLSVVRVWRGALKDGDLANGERVSGLFRLMGQQAEKVASAEAGDIVALGRMETAKTGDTLSTGKDTATLPRAEKLSPVYALAVRPTRREDEVKLSAAFTRLQEEDPSLVIDHDPDTHETILRGQGEIHLRIAVDRLRSRHRIEVAASRPRVPYKEAIRKPTVQHGRFKRQTGGHGQFGDVHIDIRPLPRGSGFVFDEQVVGGAVPRNFIPAVEHGVREYLARGPLGFPVVDLAVTLTDGSYHAVDSSEMAFKTAARLAMSEGLPKCDPVLLEPILEVQVMVPSDATPKVNALVSGRRGQLLGFDTRDGWPGWDLVTAHMPQSELHDLIVELRSLSSGAGTYISRFDHLQELQGRLADDVITAYRGEAAQ
jgi:elongation factor G